MEFLLVKQSQPEKEDQTSKHDSAKLNFGGM